MNPATDLPSGAAPDASPPRPAAAGPAAKSAVSRRVTQNPQAGKAAHQPAREPASSGTALQRRATSLPAPRPSLASAAAPAPAMKAPATEPPATAKPSTKKHHKTAARPVAEPRPKAKLVRDSFTMPQSDFELIAVLKDRALGFKRPTKKSELLRAGLQVLAGLGADALKASLERLAPLKTGRPRKGS